MTFSDSSRPGLPGGAPHTSCRPFAFLEIGSSRILTRSFDNGSENETPPTADPMLILGDLVLQIRVRFGIDADH